MFEALKGTNKILTFEKHSEDGSLLYSWTFNGKDIIKTESMNLDMSFTAKNGDKLKKKLDNYDVLPISFAYEGVLPGKATVKVKLDSNWLKSKDKDNIYVYHYNPDTDKAELIGKALKVDENGYLSFNITHCSDYFLSDKDLVEAGILPKTGSVLDNNILMFVGGVLFLVGFCLIIRRKVNKTS